MSEGRKKLLWPWIAAVLIGLAALYVAPFGPACWIVSHADMNGQFITVPYRPMIWVWCYGPESVSDFIGWYSSVGAAEGWGWVLPFDGTGQWQWTK